MNKQHHRAGQVILELPAEGGPLGALDIIGESYGIDVHWVAVPLSRLPADFFRLRSGVLGEFTQKFVTYGMRLAVIGDVSQYANASEPLRAYLVEASRSKKLIFADDMASLFARLDRITATGHGQ
jgi:hypothetical protein